LRGESGVFINLVERAAVVRFTCPAARPTLAFIEYNAQASLR
jgi:hypothetical protein